MDENNIMNLAMGLSMATTFSQIMGQTMQSAMAQQIPKPLGEPNVFALVDGQKCGPYSVENIAIFIDQGRMDGETLIWRAGMNDWMKIKDVITKNNK